MPGAQKFRKRPVEVEAIEWDGTAEGAAAVIDWVNAGGGAARYYDVPQSSGPAIVIDTLEGVITASPGDLVIRGVQGEHYPCKPDIFRETYDSADRPVEVLNVAAVDAALRSVVSDLDYDLHKQTERDECTGEDTYPEYVASFISSYELALAQLAAR